MNFNTKLNKFHHPTSIQIEPVSQTPTISHRRNQFNPYELNGGNVVGVVEGPLAVFAGDTRLSRDYHILKKDATKIHKLNKTTYILSAGAYADIINLWKTLDQHIELYELNNQEEMSSSAIASLLSRTLYSRRFFPYYVFNLVVGCDEKGNAQMWNYDAVGNYELRKQSAQGLGSHLIEPLLDNQREAYHAIEKPPKLDRNGLEELVVEAFQCCAERDITTGDNVEVYVIEYGKLLSRKVYPLRSD